MFSTVLTKRTGTKASKHISQIISLNVDYNDEMSLAFQCIMGDQFSSMFSRKR